MYNSHTHNEQCIQVMFFAVHFTNFMHTDKEEGYGLESYKFVGTCGLLTAFSI